MNTKAFFPCEGGSNLILGTGRKNQTIIFNTCVIFEKKLEWKNFYWKKKIVRKKLVEKTIFVRKKFVRKHFIGKKFCWKNICQKKTCWEIFVRKKFIGKKFYQKIFLSESGGCDKCDLICIFVYQIGRLCGRAHEISDIKAPLFLHGWVVWVVGLVVCW